MSEIGTKMFGGGAVGGMVGGVAGGIYGAYKANEAIEKIPVETVTIDGYDKPIFERGRIKSEYANFPMKNADGSLKMEHVPQKTVSGHGTPEFQTKTYDIKEPVDVVRESKVEIGPKSSFDFGSIEIGENMRIKSVDVVKYETIGKWNETVVRFNHGVNTAGYIMGYAAAGLALGALGGALIAAAISGSADIHAGQA